MSDKSWIETERGEVMVEFSRNMACYIWTCIYGCAGGWDFESQKEALDDYARHNCPMGC